MAFGSVFDKILHREAKAYRFPREKVERAMNEPPKPREEEEEEQETEEDEPQAVQSGNDSNRVDGSDMKPSNDIDELLRRARVSGAHRPNLAIKHSKGMDPLS